MEKTLDFRLADTHLRGLIHAFGQNERLSKALLDYGFVARTHDDPCRHSTADIEISRESLRGLGEELSILSPLDALLCPSGIYVRDSRVVPGPTIAVVPASTEHSLPKIGIEVALALLLARQGALSLHACGFRYNNIDFMVLGPSGAGKSTLIAAALAAGGEVLTDDQLVCYLHDDRLHARWLRKDLLLRRGGIGALPQRLRGKLQPLKIANEQRWRLARESLGGQALDCLEPDVILCLSPRKNSTDAFATHSITPVSFALTLANVIQSSSPALFSEAQFGTPALNDFTRELLARTRHFRVSTSTLLLTSPSVELDDIARAVAIS